MSSRPRRPLDNLVGRWWRRFHADEGGTTITEFLIVLPIIIMIFAAIIKVSAWGELGVQVRVEANHRTFQEVYKVHRTGGDQGLGQVISDAFFDDMTHLHPAPAMLDAQRQLHHDSPPRQTTSFGNALVTAQETLTYTAMATNGHFGESFARAQPGRLMPNSAIPGVEDAVAIHSQHLFGGGASNRGSILARDLLYDGVDFYFDLDNCQEDLGTVVSAINQTVGAAGIRPMLSAAMRYGTVTGKVETDLSVPAIGTVPIKAYFNTAIPPHVFEDKPGLQPALTTIFTRLAMQNCAIQPYNAMLGVGGDQYLPKWDTAVLEVPSPSPQQPGDHNQFSYGLDYYDNSLTEKP